MRRLLLPPTTAVLHPAPVTDRATKMYQYVDAGRHACTGNRLIVSPQSSHSRSHTYSHSHNIYMRTHNNVHANSKITRTHRCFMGCYTKVVCSFKKPFWRQKGLSGVVLNLEVTRELPVQNVYDYCHPGDGDGTPGFAALVCFLVADAALLYDRTADLHDAVVRSLHKFFGPEARCVRVEV